ncbi:MAG: hypothetical protein M3065_21320 [Actinomycetota bacterium]|nr:hypothetical protein [Actinomycetota bacterium]
MTKFRVAIDTGPEGISDNEQQEFRSDGFVLQANLERQERALWAGETPPTPSRRYIYQADARDAEHAEKKARRVVGSDVGIRVEGQRVTGPDAQ